VQYLPASFLRAKADNTNMLPEVQYNILNVRNEECSFAVCVPGRCVRASWQHQQGFTLVELIMVIIILGIISVVAMPRFADNDAFRNRAAADQTKAVLRYAQKTAIASHSPVTVNLLKGNPQNCSTTVVAGVINCVLPNEVTLSGAVPLGFDFMGRPVPNVTASVVVGGTTIIIEAETGYVR
jgi:MSHA pilin protein MshC